ncbi:unnamed protein product [Gadus morhua 'NCC']
MSRCSQLLCAHVEYWGISHLPVNPLRCAPQRALTPNHCPERAGLVRRKEARSHIAEELERKRASEQPQLNCHGDMQMGLVNPAGYSFQMLWQMWTGRAGSVGSGRTQSRSGQAQLPIDTLSGDLTAVTSQQGL